ncbi:MAG: hypothetical protein HPY73_00145 [Methanomassiliicoccales archaeon]|nr:MAG: hypothetical protein HPY73_00145 [Methanomassiliicoccales archaeon]
MKFLVCRNCKTIQKRSWFQFFTCRRCGSEGVVITVSTGILGYAAYSATAIAALLVLANIIDYDLGLGDYHVYLMFGLLMMAMVLMFFEIGRAEAIAREKANDPRLK